MKTLDDLDSLGVLGTQKTVFFQEPPVEYVLKLDGLAEQLADAQILANNVLSHQSILGCGQFEGCSACPNQKYCLRFMAKKYLERYGK